MACWIFIKKPYCNAKKTVIDVPKNINKRSQDLIPAYHDAGQFYWGSFEAWINNKPIFSNRSTIIKLSSHRVIDIDTEEDWKRAELMYKILED